MRPLVSYDSSDSEEDKSQKFTSQVIRKVSQNPISLLPNILSNLTNNSLVPGVAKPCRNDPEFSASKVKELFRSVSPQDVCKTQITDPNSIHNNDVFVFDTSVYPSPYWRIDGYDFKNKGQRPPRKKIWTVSEFKLKDNGTFVDFTRREFYMLNGRVTPGYPTSIPHWKPQLVAVYYTGTFPLHQAVNAEHGNKKRKELKRPHYTNLSADSESDTDFDLRKSKSVKKNEQIPFLLQL